MECRTQEHHGESERCHVNCLFCGQEIEDEEWHQIHDDINEARRTGEIE